MTHRETMADWRKTAAIDKQREREKKKHSIRTRKSSKAKNGNLSITHAYTQLMHKTFDFYLEWLVFGIQTLDLSF